jgi:hypothetical protein
MQISDDDTQSQNEREKYMFSILSEFEAINRFNKLIDTMNAPNLKCLQQEYSEHLSRVTSKLQIIDDRKVFSLMQIKLEVDGKEIDKTSPREAFVKGNGFLKSFNNSSILDVEPITEKQQNGQQAVCQIVAAKLEAYGGIDRPFVHVGDKIKSYTKAEKILQRIIKGQRSKTGFKLLLQIVIDKFIPGNEINIETIFRKYVSQNQMTDMYVEAGKLVIQTDNREFTFFTNGVREAEYEIHRSIFGTARRINCVIITQGINNSMSNRIGGVAVRSDMQNPDPNIQRRIGGPSFDQI